MATTYKITRFYADDTPRRVIKTGLTLDEAREHCTDPETSSRTATSAAAKARTKKHGAWFDGYSEEK